MKVVKTYEFWSDYEVKPKVQKEQTPEEWLDDIAIHMGVSKEEALKKIKEFSEKLEKLQKK